MIADLLKSVEKSPKESKKIFIFMVGTVAICALALLAIVANLIATLIGAGLPVDALLAGAIISGVAGLAGVAINQQQKADSAVRVAAFEAAGQIQAGPPVDVDV